jgi:uncharacterized protein involved in exopolysaccharide biosynthesis
MNEDSDAVGQGVEWWDVLRELRARPWTVGLIMAVALGLGVWWAAAARKLYVSQATLLVEGEGQRVVSGGDVAAVSEEVLKTIEPEHKQSREDLTKVLPVRTNAKRGAE